MAGFWLLAALCAALLTALWWALARVEALSRGGARRAPSAEAPELERLKSRLDALLGLHERAEAAAGRTSRESFCTAVLDAAVFAFSAERGAILLFDGARETLVPLAVVGPGSSELAGREVRPGDGPIGRAFQGRKLERSRGAGLPFASVPLSSAREALGVLALFDAGTGATRALDAGDERYLALLAREAVLALNQLDLLESQESFTLEMLQVLARAAEAKDQSLGDSERSRATARRVAQALRLSPVDIRRIEYAAMLHKVGKIGIDQALLSKPGKLSPAEYEKIKKYTTIGHEILSRSKSLEPVARIVLHQQEWFNGKGYPEGLQGDAIPMGSRIVCVLTAWEAMRQDRPYRKSLPREVAIAELKKGAGAQFDPAVVDAFLAVEAAAAQAAPAA